MDESAFEKDNHIDPEGLDVECLRQSEIFWRWSKLAMEAKSAVEHLKFRMDSTFSELDLACRKNPAKFGLESDKPTEGAIKAAVCDHDDYKTAVGNHAKARDDAAMLDRAVAALEMKKRMLEQLITLHGLQYFAGPSAPRNLKTVWLAQKEASEKKINERVIKVGRKRGEQ